MSIPTLEQITASPDRNSSATTPIRVLSIQQPYVDAIFAGTKNVENRSWTTKHRGTLYVHASKVAPRPTLEAVAGFLYGRPAEPCDESRILKRLVDRLWDAPGDRRTGAIIGSVDVVDVIPAEWVVLLNYQIRQAGGYQRKNIRPAIQALVEEIQEDPDPEEPEDLLISRERIERVADQVFALGKLCDSGIQSMFSGPYCWILESPRLLKTPIAAKGKLNLWKFDATPRQLELA